MVNDIDKQLECAGGGLTRHVSTPRRLSDVHDLCSSLRCVHHSTMPPPHTMTRLARRKSCRATMKLRAPPSANRPRPSLPPRMPPSVPPFLLLYSTSDTLARRLAEGPWAHRLASSINVVAPLALRKASPQRASGSRRLHGCRLRIQKRRVASLCHRLRSRHPCTHYESSIAPTTCTKACTPDGAAN